MGKKTLSVDTLRKETDYIKSVKQQHSHKNNDIHSNPETYEQNGNKRRITNSTTKRDVEACKLGNKLRQKTTSKHEKDIIMSELMNLMNGNYYSASMKHDSGRVVQAALQFGSMEQKRVIVKSICNGESELCVYQRILPSRKNSFLIELCRMKYGHFVVLKVIQYCCKDEKCLHLILRSLKGRLSKLAVHSIGSKIVESLFMNLPAKIKHRLKLELYGSRFSLFNDEGEFNHMPTNSTLTLGNIIKYQPNMKDIILKVLLSTLQKCMQKNILSYTYVHQLGYEYVMFASSADIRALSSQFADHVVDLLSTKNGVRIIAECAAYGTSKDRKRMIKALKGNVRRMICSNVMVIALIRLVQVTDDTVLIYKILLSELLLPVNTSTNSSSINVGNDFENINVGDQTLYSSPLLELFQSRPASKFFLFLFASSNESSSNEEKLLSPTFSRYLDSYEREILSHTPTILENDKHVRTSRKDDEIRHEELLGYFKQPIIDMCVNNSNELMRDRNASKVFIEAFFQLSCPELVESIVDACDVNNEVNNKICIFEDTVGHLFLKNILLREELITRKSSLSKYDERSLSLALALYTRFKGRLIKDIASSNRGAFVLTALAKSSFVRDDVFCELTIAHDTIHNRIIDSKNAAGYEALAHVLKK